MHLFLGSLWRALQSGNSPVDFVLAFVFFYLSIKNKRKQEQNERLVWRCEWFEGYLPPIVKYLKHNTFQLYALKNTLFYVLLLLLIPECNEFNKILGFHKIWKKISWITKIPKIPNFRGSPEIYNFRQNRGPSFLKFPGILVDTTCKNTRICVFPEIHEVKFRFFPEKCRPQFWIFAEIWVPPFLKFPGIVIPTMCKNARIYVFPEILETKFRFSREIFTKIFSFHENRGSIFSRIPGNFGRQNT